LQSRDPAMRFEAAVSAGELGLLAAIQRLIQLLDDADGSISEAAVTALGKIGGREAKRALEGVAHGVDERLAQAAEEALEELTFNGSGFEAELDDRDVELWRRRVVDASEMEDEDLYEEDEADARVSEDELQEDDDPWDEEEDESPYRFDEDEEEEGDEDFGDTDPFPGPAGRRPRPG
jgi:hypothetical protein